MFLLLALCFILLASTFGQFTVKWTPKDPNQPIIPNINLERRMIIDNYKRCQQNALVGQFENADKKMKKFCKTANQVYKEEVERDRIEKEKLKARFPNEDERLNQAQFSIYDDVFILIGSVLVLLAIVNFLVILFTLVATSFYNLTGSSMMLKVGNWLRKNSHIQERSIFKWNFRILKSTTVHNPQEKNPQDFEEI